MPCPSDSANLTEGLRYFPVAIDSLDHRVLALDLYLKPTGQAAPVLYRSTGVDFTQNDRQRLIEQGVEFLYIPMRQHAAYCRQLTERLDRLFHDPQQQRGERARLIRSACARMIEDVLLFPGQAEMIDGVAEISRQFEAWASEDERQFAWLLDMSAHDFYTATHMVNVGVGCGLLARQLRPDDAKLRAQLIQGGLLHDLGKRGVPKEVLNKEGGLSPHECALIRVHPQQGHDELKSHARVPDVVLEMARDHHERLDGKGYPDGVSGERIGFAARLCAVVDVFDALTAGRPYRAPTPPADSLGIMQEERGTKLDAEIFDLLAALVERLLAEDPQRALPAKGVAPRLRQHGAASAANDPPAWSPAATAVDDRRHSERLSCRAVVKAKFVWQGKPCAAAPGEWMSFRMLDVSQDGVQLQTPWPLSLNDVLELELPASGRPTLKRRARVVRVRQADGDQWLAGLRFVAGG